MRAGLPVDPAQWLALALSLAVIPAAPWLVRPAGRRAVFLAAAALTAAALSALYVVAYLRGGPRIIDATSYWLEARALAQGSLSFPVDEPVASTLGRFLVRSDDLNAASGTAAAVLFPPGYPALLALGFLAGAPLAVGPLLAAALVIATFDLAEQVVPSPASLDAPSVARLAALFSVACAALRYHTADTMSHGLSALCFCASLTLLFRALRSPPRAHLLALASGFLLGWLAAARPFSSLALALTLGLALATASSLPLAARLRLGLALAVAALPGLALLAAHQRAATGSWAASSQALYYAVTDGPPGCFRYGFGAGVGCLGEHGDFVRENLPHGYGPIQAAATTLRRLKMHLIDPANAEPLALLVPLGAALGWRWRGDPRASGADTIDKPKIPRLRVVALAVLFQIAAYVPFYFDGNYPGGGARFFADVLPLEHVLAAFAVIELSRRPFFHARVRPDRLAALALALALIGFSVRAGFDHAHLRDREGGLPMFEPHRLKAAGVERGLVFLDTDHGFNIAFDPARPSDLSFARYRGDATDRMLWEARGRPESHRYKFIFPAAPADPARVVIEPYPFDPEPPSPLIIEDGSFWPARAQDSAWALSEPASGTCASGDRWLAVYAPRGASGSVVVSLPAPFIEGRTLTPRVAIPAPLPEVGSLVAEIHLLLDGRAAHRWEVVALPSASPGPVCLVLASEPVPPGTRRVELQLRAAPETAHNHLILLNKMGSNQPFIALDNVAVGPRENR